MFLQLEIIRSLFLLFTWQHPTLWNHSLCLWSFIIRLPLTTHNHPHILWDILQLRLPKYCYHQSSIKHRKSIKFLKREKENSSSRIFVKPCRCVAKPQCSGYWHHARKCIAYFRSHTLNVSISGYANIIYFSDRILIWRKFLKMSHDKGTIACDCDYEFAVYTEIGIEHKTSGNSFLNPFECVNRRVGV